MVRIAERPWRCDRRAPLVAVLLLGVRVFCCRLAPLVVVLSALMPLLAFPPQVVARTARPEGSPPRPKTTRVLIETDGPEVVLEAKAAGADQEPDYAAGPPGASNQPSIADAEDVAEGGAGAGAGASAGDVDTSEEPLPLDEGKWDAVCSPPCQRRLPRAALFRITGAGITTSAAFNLPPRRPAVTLDVKTGTARWYWTGIVVAALGGSFLLGGAAPPLLLGGSFSTPQKILGGTGVVMLGVGLPLWIMNRTKVAIF